MRQDCPANFTRIALSPPRPTERLSSAEVINGFSPFAESVRDASDAESSEPDEEAKLPER